MLDKKISVEIGGMNKLRKKTDDTGSDIKHIYVYQSSNKTDY